MVVLVTCKSEEDPIKNEDARLLTSLYIDFSDAKGQLTPHSVVEFQLIQAFLVVLVTCKNQEDLINTECARVLTTFHPLCLWDFSDAQRQLNPQYAVKSG